jgi:hypothetical protein
MALIVLQHSVVDAFDVDPDFSVTSSTRILQGMVVGLDSSGYVSLPTTTRAPLGIAGDSISDEYKLTAYSDRLVVSPTGAMRYTSPRVSDMFNETLASGKMTVYVTGGKFATDQYDRNGSYTPGAKVYANTLGWVDDSAGSGELARPIGYVVKAPAEYPSGVPGVDSPSVDNSMSLGRYLTIHLSI